MKINKVSNLKETIKSTILMLCILLEIILFIKPDNGLIYFILLWTFLFVFIVIRNFTIFDMEIKNDIVFLRRILSQRELYLINLRIFDVITVRHPFFHLKTSAGNFKINYTNNNYQQILELLKRIAPHRIKLFELEVKKWYMLDDVTERKY
jgi:hypothetical protein